MGKKVFLKDSLMSDKFYCFNWMYIVSQVCYFWKRQAFSTVMLAITQSKITNISIYAYRQRVAAYISKGSPSDPGGRGKWDAPKCLQIRSDWEEVVEEINKMGRKLHPTMVVQWKWIRCFYVTLQPKIRSTWKSPRLPSVCLDKRCHAHTAGSADNGIQGEV